MKNVKCSLLAGLVSLAAVCVPHFAGAQEINAVDASVRWAFDKASENATRFPNLPPYRPQVSTWAAIFISTVRRGAAMRRSAVRLFPNSILVWLSGEPRKRTLMSCFPLFLKKGSLSRPRNSNSMLVSAVRAVVRSIFTP